MRKKPGTKKSHCEKVVKDIRRAIRKQYSAEEKIRVVLDGLNGEDSIAEFRRGEGIAQSLYYRWSKEFLEGARSGWRVTRLVPRHRPKSKTCAVNHLLSMV